MPAAKRQGGNSSFFLHHFLTLQLSLLFLCLLEAAAATTTTTKMVIATSSVPSEVVMETRSLVFIGAVVRMAIVEGVRRGSEEVWGCREVAIELFSDKLVCSTGEEVTTVGLPSLKGKENVVNSKNRWTQYHKQWL